MRIRITLLLLFVFLELCLSLYLFLGWFFLDLKEIVYYQHASLHFIHLEHEVCLSEL